MFESIENAEEYCFEEYDIKSDDWVIVDDPLPFCQDDFISPVRIKGREIGIPQWGVLEKLIDGKLVELNCSE